MALLSLVHDGEKETRFLLAKADYLPLETLVSTMSVWAWIVPLMVAQMPTQGVFTLYPVIGDLFAWVAVVGLVGMASWAIVRGERPKVSTGAG